MVVDASAMVEWLLRTPRGQAFTALLREHELHVPALCDVEVASALRRALLARLVAMPRVLQALRIYLDLPLARHGHSALLPSMIAMRDNFSAYDACYVALATRLEAPFLTADQAMARAVARHTSVELVQV
jgi:predicted nucleic acid-binding protein